MTLDTETLRIRKDVDEGIVEVDTGGGYRGLAPDAARNMAEMYEDAMKKGSVPRTSEVERFVELLRDYAEDVE